MTFYRFIPKSRFSRASSIYTFLFICVIIYFEFIQVWIHSMSWTVLENKSGIRILIVADPQLLGEHGELPLIGTFTRWHADRYIAQNFRVAKYHSEPDVIIFLGDVFDEGSIATEEENKRYLRRFQSIFQLQEQSKNFSEKIVYIYLPGDNDVGGEGKEAVNLSKVEWFNKSIGDIQSPVLVQTLTFNLKFLKVNLFAQTLPPVYETGVPLNKNPLVQIALAHYPCMAAHKSCLKMIVGQKPNIILSSHTHDASYYQYNREGNIQYVLRNLLLPYSDTIVGTIAVAKKMGLDLTPSSLRFDLQNQTVVHEFLTPTCSYRMGRQDMGFGLLTINDDTDGGHQKGNFHILWLPSGFRPLIIYITFYILSKVIFTPWILWKVFHWVWPMFRRLLNIRETTAQRRGGSISEKAHLV